MNYDFSDIDLSVEEALAIGGELKELVHMPAPTTPLTVEDVSDDDEEERTLAGRPETVLHRTADDYADSLGAAFELAFNEADSALKRARSDASKAYLTALVITTLRQNLKETLPKLLRKIFIAGGEAGAGLLKVKTLGDHKSGDIRTAKKKTSDFTFDTKTQAAVDWADRHAAELITYITEDDREVISNAIAELLETGNWKEALSEITSVIGDEDRARRIARNETMTAVHEGQREAWDQAIDTGYLTGDEEREWIVVGDGKVCPICESLEGKRAKLGEPFISDDGNEYEGPPAHPLCRCSEGIIG